MDRVTKAIASDSIPQPPAAIFAQTPWRVRTAVTTVLSHRARQAPYCIPATPLPSSQLPLVSGSPFQQLTSTRTPARDRDVRTLHRHPSRDDAAGHEPVRNELGEISYNLGNMTKPELKNERYPMKAYVYSRFSSTEQRKGDSLRRQTERAAAWCEGKGIALDETIAYSDLGVSGFRGKNRSEGALSLFLRACEQGRVKRGSFLILENLDRLSREHPLAAR
jgi:hypothetical protein